jgi:hypothetical protein
MATETYKVLAQSNPSAASLTDAYTVPALTSAVVSSVVVCNRSATPTTFRISVAVAGAADDNKQYLYFDVPAPANDTFIATIGVSLSAADVVRVYATLATLSFNIFGTQVA